jgi:hypothetical protein
MTEGSWNDKRSMGMREIEHEIPAYAGMTKDSGNDSRGRGNDSRGHGNVYGFGNDKLTPPYLPPHRHTTHYRHACHPTIVMPAEAGISSYHHTIMFHPLPSCLQIYAIMSAPHVMPHSHYRHACEGRHLFLHSP